ncbi:nephrin isoform X3 [Acipenser oxyrinchus oxyrinchus]|uniref:Nephrin isoform X3 n=1 Tax=Acipenser oxyrinchus oxyrinchus TaxID=40147 RepID=A0AAD8CIB6_ACIOX|nr:nephrin isoform X3 [Acipenser oxyrinchus oxyrinchus]
MTSALHRLTRALLLLCCIQASRGQQAFRIQPDNVTLVEGGTGVLQCHVEGVTGAVQWVKDGLLLGPNRSMPGFPRYSMAGDEGKGEFNLQIERVTLEDDSPYECQVGQSESSIGIISHTVWVNVLIPPGKPVIEEHSGDSEVEWVAGVEYTVSCSVTDTKPASELKFTKSSNELSGVEVNVFPGSQEKLQSTQAVVRVTPQNLDNGNRMVCLAMNEAVSQPVETGFTMRVLFPPQPPRIEGYDRPEVKAGETLSLECKSIGGNPLATLQWSKNDEVISTSWDTVSLTNTARSPLSLHIQPEDNMARLTCEAVNQVTPVPLQHTITLRVVFLPSEVKILGSSSIAEKKQLSLSCFTAASNPPVQIRWWLGFRELTTTEVTITEASNGGRVTMSNLTHTVSREENGLQLTCEAFNEAIRFTKSESILLRVLYPPQKVWIESPPEGKQFKAGTEVKLTCFSSGGNPAGSLTWFKDNKSVRYVPSAIVSGMMASRQLIVTTQPDDNLATYRCNATNEAKAPPLTATTKLHVQFPPMNVKISASAKQVKRGQSLTLTCTTGSSNPVANISWFKNGERLRGFDLGKKKAEHGGESTMGRVYIKAVSSDNGKRVTCQAYSAVLTQGVNTFYRLDVLYPPEFSPDQQRVVQAVEHDAARLPLRVSANPDNISYTWTYHGETLIKEGALRHHLKDGGELEIWNLTRTDAGDYKILCKNSEGENETLIKLDVQYSPSIKSLEDPTEVDLGDTAEIVCTADANPVTPGMFRWGWLGEEERELTADQQVTEGATGKLVITETKRSDAGLYECTVDNGIAPPAKQAVRLVVRFKPELQKGVHLSKVATSGDGSKTATLSCKAEGIPKVDYSWAKNGVGLDLNHPRYSEDTVHEGAFHTSTLTIINASAALDYAIFTCTARNKLGLDVFHIQLVSTSRPDPPTGLQVASVTHNSVTLQWTAGFDGGLEQKFRVRYHWEEAASFMYVDVFPPQATTFTITGLNAETPYNFSVNALNLLGESDYADGNAVLTVTTREKPEKDDKIPSLPETAETPPTEGPVLPLYLIVVLAVVGGVLLILNSALVACLVKKWRTHHSDAGRGHPLTDFRRSSLTKPNEYGGGELLNKAARQTLLIDSCSELSSSVYESYEADSASERGHYYYPASDFRPSLYPHQEAPECLSEGTSSFAGELAWFICKSCMWFTGHWDQKQDAHEYEQVRDASLYEEVGRPYPPPPSSGHYHSVLDRQGRALLDPWQGSDPTQGAYQRRGRGQSEYEDPMRVYDSVAEYTPSWRDYETPFEMRGELV